MSSFGWELIVIGWLGSLYLVALTSYLSGYAKGYDQGIREFEEAKKPPQ